MDGSCINLLPYQRDAVLRRARFTWNCWARQTGKSFTFTLRRLVRALTHHRNQIILSAGQRQSREAMRKVRQHCHALRVYTDTIQSSFFEGTSFRQLEITLPNGVRVIGLPANPLTARGYSGDVFLDEFAMHADDEAIWASLFPTLLRGDGQLDIASTPRGCKNMFHRLAANPVFTKSTLTLDEAIAQGLEVDRDSLRAGIDGDVAWRQEFCCEFVDESTSFMPYELIRRCHDANLGTARDTRALKRKRADIFLGVDIGRRRDLTAIWIWEKTGETFTTRGVLILDNAPFAEQENVLAELLRHASVRRCCIDATGLSMQLAETLTTRFGEHRVEGLTFTPALKVQLAGRLRVCAERGLLRIPVDDAIARDWHSVCRIASATGHIRYDADRSGDGHADRFWAAALGLHAAECDSGPVEFAVVGPSAFSREGAL